MRRREKTKTLVCMDKAVMNTNNHQLGFSLIELLLVVAIIGIISAIAVPNLLASKRAANEASAIASIRSLTSAQATYHATTGAGLYGSLSNLHTAGLVDVSLSSSTLLTPKSGYFFAAAPDATTPNSQYLTTASTSLPWRSPSSSSCAACGWSITHTTMRWASPARLQNG